MSEQAVLAAAVAGLTAALLVRRPVALPNSVGGPAATRAGAASWSARVRPGPLLVAVVALAAGGVLAAGGGRVLLLGVVGAGSTGAVVLALRRRRRQRVADHRRDLVLRACEGLVADLRAGQPPVRALERAARDWPELRPVVVAADVDADVPTALRELGRSPGAADLRAVAAAWQVAHDSGSGLAAALGVTVEALRQRRRTARLVGSEVAAARTTARLLAALPVGVLVLGSSLGGDPFGFLLETTPGLLCLALGLLLCGLGWWWLERIAEGVLEQ